MKRINEALPLAVAFGVTMAVLYLAGFWFPIQINPFQYASAADLASATLATLAIVAILLAAAMLVGGLIGQSLRHSHDALDEKRFEGALTGPASKIPSRSSVVKVILVAAWIALPLVILFATGVFKWFAIGGLVVVIAARPLGRWTMLGPASVRPYLVALILYVPFAFYGRGRVDAERATNCSRGVVIDTVRSKLTARIFGDATLLGTLGDYHFLFECSSRQVIILRSED